MIPRRLFVFVAGILPLDEVRDSRLPQMTARHVSVTALGCLECRVVYCYDLSSIMSILPSSVYFELFAYRMPMFQRDPGLDG